jgi:menaquinone-dependent protoporphyrinogen oxidase
MESKDDYQWRVSRRDFLAQAGATVGAMVLGCASGAKLSHAAGTLFPEIKCGDKNRMGNKILVAYASKYGSTGGVAEAIGNELCGRGTSADVVLTKNARNLSSYQGVIVGSAIYMGKWLSEAVDFVKENREILHKVPVAYFLVCMTMSDPTDENKAKVLAYLDPVLKAVPEIKPLEIGAFAGVMDYNNLSWLNKKILKSKGTPEGDFRDWKAIRSWPERPGFAKLIR